MFNLFEILQAQSGQSLQALGQPFGLTPEQSRRAVEALMPALSIGLQRNAADPVGLGRLFGGFNPQGGDAARGTQPDALLGQLFGSQALSQAVLQQAAAASGIGTQALRQMLPLMAGMVVAGIVHMMLNQQPTAAQPPRPEPEPAPTLNSATFWKDWMDNFLSVTDRPVQARVVDPMQAKAPDARPTTTRPVESVDPKAESAKADSQAATEDAVAEPLGVIAQIFETGAQVQEQNVKAMQELFDTFWTRRPEEQPTMSDDSTGLPPEKQVLRKPKKNQGRKTPTKA